MKEFHDFTAWRTDIVACNTALSIMKAVAHDSWALARSQSMQLGLPAYVEYSDNRFGEIDF